MTRTGLWFIVLAALCLLPAVAPGANPFLPPDSPRQEKSDTGFRPGDYLPEPVLQAGGRALAAIVAWQALIRHKAADVAREIKQDPLGPAFWVYLGLAVTTTAFGWAAFWARRSLAGKTPGRSPGRLYHLAGLAGGVFISLVGAALFFSP